MTANPWQLLWCVLFGAACGTGLAPPGGPRPPVATALTTVQPEPVLYLPEVPAQPVAVVKYVPRNVLVVGDSEACAVAPHAATVARELPLSQWLPADSVAVECKTASTVQHWNGRLRAALERHPQADTLVVFLGTNHYTATSVPPVGPILELVRDRGLTCVWVGNVAVRGKQWPVNNLLRAAVEPTCRYYDAEVLGVALADGVHPGPSAADEWLRYVWSTIPPKREGEDDE